MVASVAPGTMVGCPHFGDHQTSFFPGIPSASEFRAANEKIIIEVEKQAQALDETEMAKATSGDNKEAA